MEAVAEELEIALGADYPHLDIRKLKRLCDTNYEGRVSDMKIKYVAPTIQLLRKLKAKGIPLVQGNKVIIHLFGPKERIGVGEFFLQVSKSCPGELALKFSKYVDTGDDGSLLPESHWGYDTINSLVTDEELEKIFSLAYFEELRQRGKRENGTKRANVNFRLCVVSDVVTGKSEVVDSDEIFPETVVHKEEHNAEVLAKELPELVSDLTTLQIRALCSMLYQALADKLGYQWERFKDAPSPTEEIITDLQHDRPNYSVSDLIKALECIGRRDAVMAMYHAQLERVKMSLRGSREDITHSPVKEESDEQVSSEAYPLEESQKKQNPEELSGEDNFHHDIHHAQPEASIRSHDVMVTGDQSYDLNATPFGDTEMTGSRENSSGVCKDTTAASRRATYKIGKHSSADMQPERDTGTEDAAATPSNSNVSAENEYTQWCDDGEGDKPPDVNIDCHRGETASATNTVTSPTGQARRNGYIRGVHRSLDNQTTGTKADAPEMKLATKYARGKY